jgi:hypothetical protein
MGIAQWLPAGYRFAPRCCGQCYLASEYLSIVKLKIAGIRPGLLTKPKIIFKMVT